MSLLCGVGYIQVLLVIDLVFFSDKGKFICEFLFNQRFSYQLSKVELLIIRRKRDIVKRERRYFVRGGERFQGVIGARGLQWVYFFQGLILMGSLKFVGKWFLCLGIIFQVNVINLGVGVLKFNGNICFILLKNWFKLLIYWKNYYIF